MPGVQYHGVDHDGKHASLSWRQSQLRCRQYPRREQCPSP